jgi:N-acetylglucosamine-6-sulfatase
VPRLCAHRTLANTLIYPHWPPFFSLYRTMAPLKILWQLAAIFAGLQCTAAKQPNILFILTDDQDWHMQSLVWIGTLPLNITSLKYDQEHMPFLQKHLLHEGTLYANHYCTVALCCPSRVNMWTGRAAHNTNVTDVFPPYGESKFMACFTHELTLNRWVP